MARDLVTSISTPLTLAGKRTVAVMYSTYPWDPRPRRAAEALTTEGASVEVNRFVKTISAG